MKLKVTAIFLVTILFGSCQDNQIRLSRSSQLEDSQLFVENVLSSYYSLAVQKVDSSHPEAHRFTEIFLQQAIKSGKAKDQANAYHLHGLALQRIEENTSALENFLKEEVLRKGQKDSDGKAEMYYAIGDAYRCIFDYPLSRVAFEQSLDLFRQTRDSVGMAKALNRLAALKIDSHIIDSLKPALPLLEKSQIIASKAGEIDLQINNYLLYGSYYLQIEDFNLAMEEFKKALGLLPEAREQYHSSLILYNMALCDLRSGKSREALDLGKKAYQESVKSGLKVYQWLSAGVLDEIYNALGQNDSARKYMQTSLHARIYQIEEVRTRQQKLYEQRYLMQQNEEREAALKKERKLIIWIFAISIVSAFIIMFLLGYRYRIIIQQKRRLDEANALRDRFYSVIAHDLRSPFNSILGISEELADQLKGHPELGVLAASLNQSANRFYSLQENLLQWARFQQGMLPFNPENLSVTTLFRESAEPLKESIEKKKLTLETRHDPALKVFADSKMIEAVIRNLLSNAIKFTPPGGFVRLEAEEDSARRVMVRVSDTGIGIPEELITNLFRIDKMVQRRGTGGEASSGLGLILCKEFVEKHHGTLSVTSKEGSGTTFTFTLPAPERVS